MYINAISHYLPGQVIGNEHFTRLCGLGDEWIYKRSGIRRRTRAEEGENTHTMAFRTVEALLPGLPYGAADFDLIVGATYTPYDMVGTLAHALQGQFNIPHAAVVTVTSACSSFVNAVEVAEGYFATGKAKKALVVTSEHNSAFIDDSDVMSDYLWGDGAGCMALSAEPCGDNDMEILDVHTAGLGHIGKGVDGVCLREGRLTMPHGRDVFIYACKFMASEVQEMLKKNNLSLDDINFLVPHQANARIIDHILKALAIPPSKVISNIENYGNTGCASTVIGLSENRGRFRKGDLILVTVFGGGYSSGAILIRR